MTLNIERAVLVSIIESDFVQSDNRILNAKLRAGMFTNNFHKLIVKAINRLRELKEPVNTDFIRQKFLQANRWSLDYDNQMLEIITHQPIATFELFNSYYQQLKKNEAKYISI